MMDNDKKFTKEENLNFDLKKTLSIYIKQWKWFLLCTILTLGIAFIYIRYTAPKYEAYSIVKLVDDTDSSSPNAVFSDLEMFSNSENAKVEDEISVLKSRSLFYNVIEKLELNVSFYLQGRIYETELYTNKPFEINFIASDSVVNKTDFNFYMEVLSEIDFNFKENNSDDPIKKTFGENILTEFGGIVITPSDVDIKNFIGKSIRVQISPIDNLVDYYISKINITQLETGSRIVRFSLQDNSKTKAIEFIDKTIDEYNRISIEERNLKSKNTADFIDNRINLIATDLSKVDDNAEQFKTSKKLTDITSEADLYLSSSSQTEQELAASRTELNVVNYMKDQIDDDTSFNPIPTNVGISDPTISSTALKYNELLSNRERLLKSAGENNPMIVNLDQQLDGLRNNLKQSLDNSSKSIGIKVRSLQNQYDNITSKIYAVPGQTRELRDIEREQGTKESLYLYLLQKREEAAISLTATSPSAIVVDSAYAANNPVAPNKKLIYIGAFFIGLLIPFSVIYVDDLLDTKIHNKEDLQHTVNNITVLGEIPKIKTKDINSLVEKHDRSLLSESFRIIRTNFDYVRRGRNVKEYNNVVFVTSTINGEGKSFFSMNFALTLANTGKRVLLIGADIRNPKTPVEIKNQKKKNNIEIGLTEYLIDDSIIVGSAINTYEINGNQIDVLLSGKVPPNPAELLMSDRIKLLFDKVSSQYDYVIVDTAPSMLVTDTLLFSHYAGHTIYMTRADYTEKRILNFAKELHTENRLNGMMLVVNDVKESNFGYGAKYGYYGTQEKKNLFKRIFS
ncbi:polysaccharide biosynthesis tyrosine autokinase [Flavobacteriaceae bacterium XHP0103]|uniref:GumC family protein n=1 Tax=Marixanthotalea marina TaxID=2844359 RepID=UPI002989E11E|nr:polysaccharide biosynthesis tyrosine autokinase [Marixanthotalea marina]MBU3822276.1 polysaccharide biosynthesis tyrosine autokinase [Marixanthotalea marina]